MTERKFTPGPWALDDDGWICAGNEPVCMIESGGITGFFPHAQADANLIAAAPEMYDLLDCAQATGMLEHGGLGDAIRSALAKARGETK